MPAAVNGMKECSKCGETKEVSEYYKHIRVKDGYQSSCKKCCNVSAKVNSWERERKYLQNMAAGIYEIRCTATDVAYVGQSKQPKKRWTVHKSGLRRGKHENLALQSDYNKYGLDAFEFNVISEYPSHTTSKILLEAEAIEILKRVRAKQEIYNNAIPQDDGKTFIDVDYTEEEFAKIVENSIKLDMTMTEFVCKAIRDFNLSHLPQNNSEINEKGEER